MILAINPKRLFMFLVGCITVLTILSLTVLLIGYITGHGRLGGLGTLLSAGKEANVPTWYSSIALMLCSGMLWTIASAKKRSGLPYAGHWRFMSLALALASTEEICSMHNRMGELTQRVFTSGFVHDINWIAPMSVFVLLFFAAYYRFLRDLPSKTRNLLILAAAVFVSGSMGMEFLEAIWRSAVDENRLLYIVLMTFEEAGEMMGVAILAYTLSSYIDRYMPDLKMIFNSERISATAFQSERPVAHPLTAEGRPLTQ